MITDVRNVSMKKEFVLTECEVYDNTYEAQININESKARVLCNSFFRTKCGGTALSFLGLALSTGTALVTATFQDVFDIPGSAVFLACLYAICTGVFLVAAVIFGIKWLRNFKRLSEDAFIQALKGEGMKNNSHVVKKKIEVLERHIK